MKRKIFSKLLAGALLVASVSSFVSCKDYDDDINNLQKQIDNAALKSDLSALQTTLTSVQSTANSAATSAQQALTNAGANATDIAALKSTATQLGNDIAAAAKAAADAATAAQNATVAAEAAEAASDAAVAAASAAAAEAAEKANKDAEEKIQAAIADFTSKFDAVNAAAQAAAGLKDDVTTAQTAAQAAKDAADNAAKLAQAAKDAAAAATTQKYVDDAIKALEDAVNGKIDALEARVKALESTGTGQGTVQAMGWEKAITSVELVYANGYNVSDNLYFYQGKQALDYTFGTETTEMSKDQYQEYKKGNDIIFRNNIIVRVSPANAELTTENIKLFNSLGENLDEVVKIQKVERYNDLLVTRASETGLWLITFARQEKATDSQYAKATKGREIDAKHPQAKGKGLYAIAVNNTADASANRYAVTDYHFAINYGAYQNTYTLDFTVNGENVYNFYNRWSNEGNNQGKVVAEDGTKAQGPADYKWKKNAANHPTPAALPVITTGDAANVDWDARHTYAADKNFVAANVNEPIKIEGIDQQFIDYYYIVVDKECAIESAPSELRAWQSYVIEGVNKKIESGTDAYISITDEGADPEGDIIGFRVFGVNYDGTLADPDGVAFYVQVGMPVEWEPIVKGNAATFTPKTVNLSLTSGVTDAYITGKNNTVLFECNFSELKLANDITISGAQFPSELDVLRDDNMVSVASDTKVAVRYLANNEKNLRGEYNNAYYVNDIKYVAITVQNAEDIVDGYTFTTEKFDVFNPDNHSKKIAEIQFNLKKGDAPVGTSTDYPNGAKLNWLSDYQPVDGVVTLYPSPVGGWSNPGGWATTIPATGYLTVDLAEFSQGLRNGVPGGHIHQITITQTKGDYITNPWTRIPASEINGGSATTDNTNSNSWSDGNFIGQVPENFFWWGNAAYTYGYDYEGTTFEVLNGIMNAKSQVNPKTRHTAYLNIVVEGDGDMVSRQYPGNIASEYRTDALTQTYTTRANYTVVDQAIHFDDVMLHESYSTDITYVDNTGSTTAAYDATKDVTKQNKLWVSWNQMGATDKIHLYYTDRTTGTPWVKAAGAQWTTATEIASVAAMLNKAENTAVKSFGPAVFDPNYYKAITASNMSIISPNGAVNEYLKVASSSTITNIVLQKSAGTMPRVNMNLKLRINCTDVLGNSMNVDIPFELNVNE